MQVSTKAIVLKNVKYGDNKNIVVMLTERYGKIPYMVYGAHSKKSSLRSSALQVLSVLDVQMDYRENRKMQTISAASPIGINTAVYADPAKSVFAFFVAEVMEKCIFDAECDEAVFNYALACVERLNNDMPLNFLSAVKFLLSFSRQLGFYPYDGQNNEFIAQYPNERSKRLLVRLLSGDTAFTKDEINIVLKIILDYYKYNLPTMTDIASLKVLEDFLEV